MSYLFLSDDLTELSEGFDTCRKRSTRQTTTYLKPPKGKTISHDQFGRESEKPVLRLFKQDGYDDEPVGSLSAKSARAFWYLGGDHQFLPMMDLVRLGFFFHLDFVRATLLTLKGEWERHLADEREYRTGIGMNLVEVFQPEVNDGEIRRFKPLVEEMHNALLALAQGVQESETAHPFERAIELEKLQAAGFFRYDLPRFRTLVEEMILHRLFLCALGDLVVIEFTKGKEDEFTLLDRGTEQEQRAFWSSKATWIELQDVLGDLLLTQEQARLRNAHVQADFLRIFGKEYVALQQSILDLRTWERRLMTRQAHPDWSEQRIDEVLQESERQAREELDKLRQDASLIQVVEAPPSDGILDGEEIAAYFQKLKKVLREIYLLFHEDRLAHDPVYGALTADQKTQLDKLLKRALDIKADQELHYAKGTLGYANRSLTELVNILERGRAILKHAGIDVKVEYLVQGNTLAEKTGWLHNEIETLRHDIAKVRAQIIAFSEDRETREKKLIVDSVADHARIREDFATKCRDYEAKTEALVHQYETLKATPC